MGTESERGEFEPVIDMVCDRIISHLEGLKQKTLKNQEKRSQVDAVIPKFGGDAAHHYEEEARLIDDTINGVREKDPKFLIRFINRPMQGLDLTEEEKKELGDYCRSVSERAA